MVGFWTGQGLESRRDPFLNPVESRAQLRLAFVFAPFTPTRYRAQTLGTGRLRGRRRFGYQRKSDICAIRVQRAGRTRAALLLAFLRLDTPDAQ